MTLLSSLTVFAMVQANGIIIPNKFQVTLLASELDSPKGIISANNRAGAGVFGHDLYVAESGNNDILKVDKSGAGATLFAGPGMLNFPVGVTFFGGAYGPYLYVGNAFAPGGLVRIHPNGTVTAFALPNVRIAGLDFGRGAYGSSLYAGEWTAGNIWKVDPAGNAVLFSSNPGNETRYLKFSHGNAFGTYLFYTDYWSGKIYKVAPDGSTTLFADTGDVGLEGLAFSPGGTFGHYLYTGSIQSGKIYQVKPDGTYTLWASGFGGVADIHFEPGGRGGFIMYIVDGQNPGNVYAISKK